LRRGEALYGVEELPGRSALQDYVQVNGDTMDNNDSDTRESTHVSDEKGDDAGWLSVLLILNILLRRWRTLAYISIAAAVIAVAVALLLPMRFTARAMFIPEGTTSGLNLPGGLSGLASQIGVSLPGGENSARFYADLLRSRTIQDQLLQSRFADPRSESPSDSSTLIDLFGIDRRTEAKRFEAARRRVGSTTGISVDRQTNTVQLTVETRHAALSAAVANRYLELLNQFNLNSRQSSGRERRQFIEQRLPAADDELRQSEEDLREFLEQNRQFDRAPQLQFQYERLQRRVAIKQEVLTTLHRQHEEARIDEVNDTPMITVIDQAIAPASKSKPRRKMIVVVAFVLGLFFASLRVLTVEFLASSRGKHRHDYDELGGSWANFKKEIRSIFSLRRRSQQ